MQRVKLEQDSLALFYVAFIKKWQSRATFFGQNQYFF